MLNERANALKEQEDRLGALMAQLQMQKAREVRISTMFLFITQLIDRELKSLSCVNRYLIKQGLQSNKSKYLKEEGENNGRRMGADQ